MGLCGCDMGLCGCVWAVWVWHGLCGCGMGCVGVACGFSSICVHHIEYIRSQAVCV